MRRMLMLLTALFAGACGGGEAARDEASSSATPIGMSGAGTTSGGERPDAVTGSVELTLRRADGTFLEVGELRGRVTLLFVLATFDTPSQMLLSPLRDVAEAHPELAIVGIAAQPNARLLIDAYEHALSPPFPITYDPEETLTAGESALGELQAIPTLIVLDRRGVEVARHAGFADRARIEELLRAAR